MQIPAAPAIAKQRFAPQLHQIARAVEDQLGAPDKGCGKAAAHHQPAQKEGNAGARFGANGHKANAHKDQRKDRDKDRKPERIVLDDQLIGGVAGDLHRGSMPPDFPAPSDFTLAPTGRSGILQGMDNWDEIRTAFQVARMGTVSGAAEVLGVHHATVIRHIDALEQRLGAKLFQRHARGYTPTEAGEDLLRVAQSADDQFSQLSGRIKGRGSDVAGDLVVTSLVSLAGYMAPMLARFQRLHPAVVVRYVTGERLFRLEYGEAHVAVRAGAAPEQPDNVVQPLVQLQMAAYASTSYVEAHGAPNGPEDYTKHRFVGPENRESRAPCYVWMRKMVPEDAVTFRCTDAGAVGSAILSGAGIGFMPVTEAQKYPDLVQVHAARDEWASPLWLVTHVDLHRTFKVQALLSFIKDEVKEEGW